MYTFYTFLNLELTQNRLKLLLIYGDLEIIKALEKHNAQNNFCPLNIFTLG